jgi:hypothetical protein
LTEKKDKYCTRQKDGRSVISENFKRDNKTARDRRDLQGVLVLFDTSSNGINIIAR